MSVRPLSLARGRRGGRARGPCAPPQPRLDPLSYPAGPARPCSASSSTTADSLLTPSQSHASSSSASGEYAQKLASLHARIVKERKILEGFQAMRAATANQDVIRTCDAKIRDAQRTIGWFEDSIRQLEGRGAQQQQQPRAPGQMQGHAPGGRQSFDDPRQQRMPPPSGPAAYASAPPPGAAPSYVQPQAYGATGPHGRIEARDTVAPAGPGGAMVFGGQKARDQFTNLGASLVRLPLLRPCALLSSARADVISVLARTDLIKSDTPLTTAKISRMLHQLEFKLHVERQYKEGIDKMAKLYLVDGDKKARCVPLSLSLSLFRSSRSCWTCADERRRCRADTENKRVESKQKMVLLNQALKKYKALDVMGELGEEEDSASLFRLPSPCSSSRFEADSDPPPPSSSSPSRPLQASPRTSSRTCVARSPARSRSRSSRRASSRTRRSPRRASTRPRRSSTSRSRTRRARARTRRATTGGTRTLRSTSTRPTSAR